MKYGETLRQRSVPQWAYQNVDYDSIKNLIKDHTTPGKGKAIAISIPGQQNESEVSFENLLFSIFLDQHHAVSLFVKSKSGEIQRRLDHLERQLRSLQVGRWPPSVIPNRIPSSRLAKYARIEQQANETGEEIKSLSRFIGAQRLALTKLLKKYKKWTGSESLEWRFKTEVLSRPDSFTKLDLGPHLDHWTDVLQDIRVATGTGRAGKSGNTSSVGSPVIHAMLSRHVESSTAVSQRIQTAISSGLDVDFDSVLANTPLGHQGSRAVYWVHPEQLVELQILLLQHTRLSIPKRPSIDASSSGSGSPSLTHQSPVTTRDGWVERDADTGVIVLDNVEEFAHVQSSTPLSDGEDSSGRPRSQPAATIHWSLKEDITISIRDELNNSEWDETKIQARIRRKHLGAFLDVENTNAPWRASETAGSGEAQSAVLESQKVDEARTWLASHGHVKALVAISSRRTRFVNLPNARASGQWCVLDSDISMKKVSVDDLAGKEWPSTIRHDATRFQYAVLEVRQEGKNSTDIIKILDESHLTERIRGFSLAAHAIWSCCKPRTMTPPFWLPVLSKDIRKVPLAVEARRGRKDSTSPSYQLPTHAGTSTDTDGQGTSSTAVADSSATSLPTTPLEGRDFARKSDRTIRYAPDNGATGRRPPQIAKQTRYWSEYDHPEDSSDSDNGYYIYVDPNEDTSWVPFRSTATKIFNGVSSLFCHGKVNRRAQNLDVESDPLLPTQVLPKSPLFDGSLDDETTTSSSSSDEDDENLLAPHILRAYGTLPQKTAVYDPATAPPEDTITALLTSSLSLFFSVTLSLVLLVLSATGRRNARGEIDIVVIVGVVVSLAFAAVGFWGMVRGRGVGLTRWAVAGLVFAAVVLGDGVLVGWVLSQFQKMPHLLDDGVQSGWNE